MRLCFGGELSNADLRALFAEFSALTPWAPDGASSWKRLYIALNGPVVQIPQRGRVVEFFMGRPFFSQHAIERLKRLSEDSRGPQATASANASSSPERVLPASHFPVSTNVSVAETTEDSFSRGALTPPKSRSVTSSAFGAQQSMTVGVNSSFPDAADSENSSAFIRSKRDGIVSKETFGVAESDIGKLFRSFDKAGCDE